MAVHGPCRRWVPPGPGTTDLRGRPGTRAPHVWLTRDGGRLSSLDLLGRGFVLLAGSEGTAWRRAAEAVARRLGIRLEAVQVESDHLEDPERRWHSAHGVKPRGAVLVRPDGIVAWRSRGSGAAPEETLTQVLAQLLSRPEAAPPPLTP